MCVAKLPVAWGSSLVGVGGSTLSCVGWAPLELWCAGSSRVVLREVFPSCSVQGAPLELWWSVPLELWWGFALWE